MIYLIDMIYLMGYVIKQEIVSKGGKKWKFNYDLPDWYDLFDDIL